MSEIEEQEKPQPTLSLKIKDIELDKSWPCQSDILERHNEIENLTPVILNVDAPLVLAIEAPWGGGKTTFIRLWQKYLQTLSKDSFYINAWESDFSDDPLLPILSKFDQWVASKKNTGAGSKAWDKAKRNAPAVLRKVTVAGIKLVTMGGIDASDAIEGVISETAGNISDDLIAQYSAKANALELFKEELGKSLSLLPEGQKNLIVFVDELDRCRPSYAIETLERIKHLFDIPNIVFVLAMNKDQLSKSVQGVYGNNFNGLNYLKRFVDMEYSLKLPEVNHFLNCKINTTSLLSFFKSMQNGRGHRDALEATLCLLVKRFDYTLRDVEQIISKLNLICLSIKTKSKFHPITLVSMLVLYNENRNLYLKYLDDGFEINNVIEYLFVITPESPKYPSFFGNIAGWLIDGSYDPENERSLDPIFKPWGDVLTSIDKDSHEFRELKRLSQFQDDKNENKSRGWSSVNVRKMCSRSIELMNEISIN